jgi:hypothetical protein
MKQAGNWAVLVWLMLTQAIGLLSLLPWVVVAAFSCSAFEAPPFEQNWQTWALAAAVLAYPILPLGGIMLVRTIGQKDQVWLSLAISTVILVTSLAFLSYLVMEAPAAAR